MSVFIMTPMPHLAAAIAELRRRRYNGPVGEAHAQAKLNVARVRELRADWRAGETILNMSRRTGLSKGTLGPMLHGKTWAHVQDEVTS